MRGSGRFWLIIVAALVLVTVLIGGAGSEGPPLDPRSVSPDGARGIVEVLEDLGAEVTLDDPVPGDDATAALLLLDRLSDDDRADVERWVDRGGVLVVADPTSELTAPGTGFAGAEVRAGACSIRPLADAVEITARGRTFAAGDRGGCFGSPDRAYVSAASRGAGTVVSVGGPRLFTNRHLDELDNAFVAVSLLAPEPAEARVAVLGPSVFEFGEGSAAGRIAPRVGNAIVMALASFLIFALHRMRRLGPVIDEPLPVQIRGSELVLQAGVLGERAADPAGAAEVIRDDFIRRWRTRLADPDADPAALARLVPGTSDPSTLESALTSTVASNDDLVQVVAVLDRADGHTKGMT